MNDNRSVGLMVMEAITTCLLVSGMVFVNWFVLPNINEAQHVSKQVLKEAEKSYKQTLKNRELIEGNHELMESIRKEVRDTVITKEDKEVFMKQHKETHKLIMELIKKMK